MDAMEIHTIPVYPYRAGARVLPMPLHVLLVLLETSNLQMYKQWEELRTRCLSPLMNTLLLVGHLSLW